MIFIKYINDDSNIICVYVTMMFLTCWIDHDLRVHDPVRTSPSGLESATYKL